MKCNDIGCTITRIKDLIRQSLWVSGAGGVVIGVSGGIDSAVSVGLSVAAVGSDRVIGVNMPTASNSQSDRADIEELCNKFKITLLTVPLDTIINSAFLDPEIKKNSTPLLRGNFTSRIRMAVLYHIAASHGYLVCGTSNKTEYMIGYCTKWGDNAADIQPIQHLLKKDVYAVAKELEIPESIINKAPSAGFWEGQSDEAEIGMSYADVDKALIQLELHNFIPENENEEKILSLVKKSQHKRYCPSTPLVIREK